MKKLFFVLSLLSGCFIGFSVVRPSSYASVTPAACLRDSLSRTNADGSVFTEYVARPLPTLVQSGVPSYDEDLFTADPQLNSPGFHSAVGCRAAQQFVEPLSLPAGTVRSDYAFGQILYTSDVTPTGARTYTVPIAVPEDLKFPSGLALQYSSQAGNGIAGYGWSLSGLPAIMMTGKNIYYDNTSQAPDLNDSSPVFSLDGMRLVKSSGPLRSSYSLETVTGNILVQPFWNGLVLQHFDVLYPDGAKAVFGFPGDTKTRISYPLTKMTDRFGREVIVSYDVEDANGTNYPSSVRCVENGKDVWRAVFSYMLRMDTFSSYYAGQRVFLRQMLTDIKTYFNGQRTYTYKLAYASKDSVMELKAIRCMTSDEELPPLNFSYGENVTQYGHDFQNVSQNFLSRSFTSGDIRYLRGKFRSGNYSDGMVMLPVFSTYSEVASLKHWGKIYRQFGSTYSPDQEIVVVPCVGNMTDLSIKAEEGFQTVEVLDTDDDGTDEIVKVNFTGLDGEYSKYRVKIYKFNENATKLDSTVIDTKFQGVVNDGNKLWSPHCRTFIFGKFDYRGGAQLLSVSYNRDFKEQPVQSITSVLDLSTGKCVEHVTFDLTPGREHELVVADIDGDGWTDLCLADGNGLKKCVYQSNDHSFVFYGSYAGLPVEELGPDYYIADLNGDALTDFLVPPAVGGGSTWNVFYFTGHEFVKQSMEICTRAEGDRFIFMDVDRDGLADMTLVSGGRLNYWINNGGTFSKNRAVSSLSLPANCGVVPANVLDFNSPSQFVTVEGFYVKGYEFSCNRSSNRLLTKFENSLGAVEVNRYGDMCVSADVYQKDRERSYTLSNGFSRRAFHLNLLLGSETYPDENSSDCASNKSYTWFDAVYNSKGQGFCGFGKNRCIDYIDNSITVNVFDPERRGIPVSSTVKQSGKPTAIVDHRGDTTSISYDMWGSLLETVSPDGTRSKVSTSWGGTGLYATTEWSNIAPSVVTCYDSYGRKIRTATQCYDGRWRIIDYEYDAKGRISRTSLPFRAASPEDGGEKLWNVTAYDVYGRKTSEILASGNRTTWEYHDNSVIETKNGVAVSRTYDAYGNLVLVSDAGGTLTYSLRTDGRPLSVSDSKGTITKFDYDGYGRRSSIEDPSAGKTTDSYGTSNGQIVHTVKNPNGTIVTYTDAFGRVAKIDRQGEFQTEYSYNEDGQLVSEVSTNGTKKVRSYDSYGRLASETETIPDGKWLETTYSYNFGTQMKSAAYSCHTGQIAAENFLYGNGTLAEIVLSDGMIVTRIEDENALGQPLRVTTGEIQRDYTYTATGLPVGRSMAGGFLMDFEYDINALNGNLTSRTDRQHGLSETFSYDALNRLSYMDDRKVRYAPDGNLLSIDGVGEMLYTDEGSPYRITSFTPEDMSTVLSREQSVNYTCYGRPSRITEGGRSASFTYNGDGDRVKMFYSEGVSAVLNRYYVGGRYEQDIRRDGTSVERFYLGGNAYSAPMVLEKNGGSGWTPLNIGRDYLGSITTIATVDGNPLEEYSYDPWGRLRDPETHEIYAQGAEPELRLGRGFTSHEHLSWFGLINMNARLYDPLLCRFLSPDPYVQSPDFSQSFNRYSYAFNNPLAYNDPSGELFLPFFSMFIYQ